RAIGSPKRRTAPVRGVRMPVRSRRSVVFPEPLGPMSPANSPSRTAIEKSRKSGRSGKSKQIRWAARASVKVGLRVMPAVEKDEAGSADQHRQNADRDFGGGEERAGQRVGQDQRGGPQKRRR